MRLFFFSNRIGVIGVTYFTKNKHVSHIQHLLRTRNQSAHLSFSAESRYALEGYLDLHGLGALNKDSDLMTMLSQSQSNDRDGNNEGEDETALG